MPNWVSNGGEWVPAKEYAVLPHLAGTGKEIYNGPDRAALYQLYEIDKTGGQTTLGQHFTKSPEFLEMIRKLGFNNAKEYLESIGYDEKEAKKLFEKNASSIAKHELPKRIAAIETPGGGTDMSGVNKTFNGGFGQEQLKEAK